MKDHNQPNRGAGIASAIGAGVGVAIGTGVGAALGSSTGEIGFWLPLGAGIGTALGSAIGVVLSMAQYRLSRAGATSVKSWYE